MDVGLDSDGVGVLCKMCADLLHSPSVLISLARSLMFWDDVKVRPLKSF